VPSRQQWRQWSLPSKLTALGAYIGVIGVVLSALFFALPHALPPSPIVASPARLSLGGAQYRLASPQLRYHNRSDAMLYDVWVKITIFSDLITYKDLKVRFDDAPSKDLVWRLSAIDPKGRPAEYFLLEEIPPHGTYVLSLVDTRTWPLSPSQHFVTSEVLGFSNQPHKLQKRTDPEDLLRNLVIPEDVQVMRIWAHYPWEQDLRVKEMNLDQSKERDAQQ
jgi:hypothetical protein